MKKAITALTGLALIGLAVPAIAAADHHGGRKGGHGDRFAAMDTNGDGAVTKAEADAHRAAMFAEIDANKDGNVTPAEMQAHHDAKRAEMRAKREAAMMAKLDTNTDGVISAAEFAAAPAPGFDKLDTDKDGTVSKAEMAAAQDKMKERRGKWRDRAPE